MRADPNPFQRWARHLEKEQQQIPKLWTEKGSRRVFLNRGLISQTQHDRGLIVAAVHVCDPLIFWTHFEMKGFRVRQSFS
jgi:hypothetical protein